MNDPIFQCSPLAGYAAHKAQIDAAIMSVLDSGRYILGNQVRLFEAEFAAVMTVKCCIGVASGTDAIEMALRASGTGPGDVIFAPSHTAVATIAAIERAGGVPFLVEIDPNTFTMDPHHLERAIKTVNGGKYRRYRARAIIPVHLYGHPADMPAIMEIASQNGLVVIEDCAQAHGAALSGRNVGSWGNMGAFSFYPTKNLGALGDGGAVVTNDPDLAEKLHLLREYGWEERGISASPGINSRLDELQAAALRIKLKYLFQYNQKRIAIAEHYRRLIKENEMTLTPKPVPEIHHVYHQFVIKSDYRNQLMRFLKTENIATAIHYPKPVHLQPAYKDRVPVDPKGLPLTEEACRKILSLPMYPEMSEQQVKRVCEALNRFRPK